MHPILFGLRWGHGADAIPMHQGVILCIATTQLNNITTNTVTKHNRVKAKRIRSVQILGHKIPVIYTTWPDGQWGECDLDNRVIRLSQACLLDAHQQWLTLVHEVTHMIFGLTGLSFMEDNNEEAFVRCIEGCVVPWLEANAHKYKP